MTFPLRIIRSYMRREGHMSNTQETAFLTDPRGQRLHLTPDIFDFAAIFKRQAPCVLEIGFGMGASLLIQAQQNPQIDYLGIEVHRPGLGQVLAEADQKNLTNIRVLCGDAKEVLMQCIADNSLDGIQIFFPDPWHKRRHHKRRLIQTEFVSLLIQKLTPHGKLCLATDWEDYAKQMLRVLNEFPTLTNIAGENQFAPRPLERPLTKYELRGQRLGHGVWDLVFEKKI